MNVTFKYFDDVHVTQSIHLLFGHINGNIHICNVWFDYLKLRAIRFYNGNNSMRVKLYLTSNYTNTIVLYKIMVRI